MTDEGNDLLNGGAGKDTAILRINDNVILDLQAGGTADFGFFVVTLKKIENVTVETTFSRADRISGDNRANRFDAGQGDDQLNGRGGNDILLGRTGNDILTGGKGADTMTGHEDSDTFVYLGPSDSTATNRDRITDFVSGIDKLNFANFLDGAGNAVDFSYIGGNAFSGGAPNCASRRAR